MSLNLYMGISGPKSKLRLCESRRACPKSSLHRLMMPAAWSASLGIRAFVHRRWKPVKYCANRHFLSNQMLRKGLTLAELPCSGRRELHAISLRVPQGRPCSCRQRCFCAATPRANLLPLSWGNSCHGFKELHLSVGSNP